MTNNNNKNSVNKFIDHNSTRKTVNKLVYVVGIGGNIAVIPQIIKAWQSNAPGLAIITWILFILIGFIWLIYAIQQ